MMVRIAVFALILMTFNNVLAADRPSEKQVAEAVLASHEKYEDEHPTPELIKELGKQISILKKERGQTLKDKSPEERKNINSEAAIEIDALTARLNSAKKRQKSQSWDEYLVLPVKSAVAQREELETTLFNQPRLARLDWERLQIGTVGWVGLKGAGFGNMKCVQRLPDGRWLGEGVGYNVVYNGPQNVAGPSREFSEKQFSYGIVLVSGIDTDLTGRKAQDGVTHSFSFNAIVTGEHTYTTASGASKTVFVVEKFNPGIPFK